MLPEPHFYLCLWDSRTERERERDTEALSLSLSSGSCGVRQTVMQQMSDELLTWWLWWSGDWSHPNMSGPQPAVLSALHHIIYHHITVVFCFKRGSYATYTYILYYTYMCFFLINNQLRPSTCYNISFYVTWIPVLKACYKKQAWGFSLGAVLSGYSSSHLHLSLIFFSLQRLCKLSASVCVWSKLVRLRREAS